MNKVATYLLKTTGSIILTSVIRDAVNESIKTIKKKAEKHKRTKGTQ